MFNKHIVKVIIVKEMQVKARAGCHFTPLGILLLKVKRRERMTVRKGQILSDFKYELSRAIKLMKTEI
jgi:hypothetical protein